MLKLAHQQHMRTIDVDGKSPVETDMPKHSTLTPIVANIPRNEFDQLQRPFSFLANVGGKETASHLFTTNIDKNLLKNMKFKAYQGTSSLLIPSHKKSMIS